MNMKPIRIAAAILLACFVVPLPTLAADVEVVFSVDSSQSDGETVRGTMTVQVINLTQAALHNVDLRLNLGGANAIGHGVLAVGNVDAANVATIVADFRLEQGLFDLGAALPLRVDFDDASSNRRSLTINAMRGY